MEMMFRYVFTVPSGQPWRSHTSYNNFYHRIQSRQYKNKIKSTESIPDNGVSCEPDAAAATVAAATVAAATATCTELEVSAERDNMTQLKGMGESNDESAEDRRIRYQNLYFEYFDGDALEMYQAREMGLYPPCGGKRESQYRARPGSLLKPSLDGYLPFPVASADYAKAPHERPQVFGTAREEDFEFTDNACGYTLVNLCDPAAISTIENSDVFYGNPAARAGWLAVGATAGNGSDGTQLQLGTPLFIDHFDDTFESKKHLNMSAWLKEPTSVGHLQCKALATSAEYPSILIDESGMRFDNARWGAPAKSHPGLNSSAAAVHALVVNKMPPQFHEEDSYRPTRTYKEDHASALATMEKALRQCFHVDTYEEGFSVLVAVETDFRLVVLKGSLQLIRRVAQLWEIYTATGSRSPSGAPPEEWWDYCCWRQLQREGWGTTRCLGPVTLSIPKGHALIFSTWLLHAGAEWQEGDMSGYNRMHFYFTKTPLLRMQSVFMQDRSGLKGTSFSPALHFLPLPDAPGSTAAVLPLWKETEVAERLAGLRRRSELMGLERAPRGRC